MGLVAEVETAQDNVGWRADLDVLLLVCKVVVKVRVHLHGDLLAQANGDVDSADDCDCEQGSGYTQHYE